MFLESPFGFPFGSWAGPTASTAQPSHTFPRERLPEERKDGKLKKKVGWCVWKEKKRLSGLPRGNSVGW